MKRCHRSYRTVCICGCFGMTAAAVETGAAQVTFGITGGLNFATFEDVQVGAISESFDRRTGIHAGLFLDLQFGSLAVRPGVTYLNVGSLFEGATFLDPNEFEVNYLAIPIDLRLQIPFKLVSPYVFTGPEFRSLASTDAQGEFREQLEDFVMVWGVGAGVKIGSFYPELRYSFDLSGVTADAFDVGGVRVVTQGADVHTVRVSLGIGF